jgi:divalent metal cation (Fe/Co/Zn/Cd) transporter
MPIFQDTLIITDDSHDHAVEVTVTVPKDVNITNVKHLAEQAWRSAKKEITVDGVTVKVRMLGR